MKNLENYKQQKIRRVRWYCHNEREEIEIEIEKKKKKRMAKTAQPKSIVIDGKAYLKCPYPDCDHMARDWGYDPKSGLRREMLGPGKIYVHIREVHGLVWLRKGKTAGWWSLSKFHHHHHPTKSEEGEEERNDTTSKKEE